MEDKPFRFWAVYLAILSAILFIGWKQPLRYRFMTHEQIWREEHPEKPVVLATPAPKATPTQDWKWDKNRRTLLDP